MKKAELQKYTEWLAENFRVYKAEKNLWEKNDGTQIVPGEYLPAFYMYYLKFQKSKAKGVFGFLARLLPFLILPILPVKPTVQDTARIDTVRTIKQKELMPLPVWVIRKLPKQ